MPWRTPAKVVCISEPYAYTNTITSFPKSQFSLYSCQESLWTGLLVRSQYGSLWLHKRGDVTARMIQVSPMNLLLVASVCYSPREPIEPVLHALNVVLGNSSGVNVLNMGDFNSKSTLWGGDTLDTRDSSQRLVCVRQARCSKRP